LLAIAEYEANVQAHNLEVMVSESLAAVDWTQVDVSVAPILDGYFDPRSEEVDFDIIGSQPILEREVCSYRQTYYTKRFWAIILIFKSFPLLTVC